MRVEVDETHRKARPGARETVALPGVGGISDAVAAQRSIQEPAAGGDVCMFTKLSYLARRALSKRSKTPYVVILLGVTDKIQPCAKGRNRNPIQLLNQRFSCRGLSDKPDALTVEIGWNGNAGMVL